MAEIFSQRVQTTVNTKYIPYCVDTVLGSNVMFQRVVKAAKKWSGRELRAPVKYKKNITGQEFGGFDTFSTSATDNRINLAFEPRWYQITVALPGDELSVAKTDEAVLNLMKLQIQSDTEDMADDLGTIFYNGGTNILGLAQLVDDGNITPTIGGQSRTTYTTLASTVTSSSGTLTLAKMDTMWNAVTSGNQKPTIIPTTETVFSLYGQLLNPMQRINISASTVKGGLKGEAGFTGLDYKGIPIIADEKCPTGKMYFLNENFLDFYALPYYSAKPVQYSSQMKGNDYGAPLGLGFSWTDWIIPSNSASVVGHIYFGGQFITNNPKRHGVLTSITGV
jgi:hypothetical protein